MDGWTQIAQVALPQPSHGHSAAPPPGITTLAFDDQQDLLWVGDELGSVRSFAGVDLRRYTAWRAHPPADGPVKQLMFCDKGVLSLGSRSVHLSTRYGLTVWHVEEKEMVDLRCMSYVGKSQDVLLVAGFQKSMFKIDVAKGKIIEEIPTIDEYSTMKNVGQICAATSKGTINLLDSNTLQVVGTLNTGTSSINDMDGGSNYLVTCCWVNPAQGTPKLNIVANVYDVNKKVQLSPIAAQAGAAFVQLHPLMSTTCIICSQHGNIQTVDLTNPAMSMSQSTLVVQTHVSGMVLAPSGEALALVDSGQAIQLIAPPSVPVRFARKYGSQSLEWVSQPQPVDHIDIDADIPLSTIGVPFYRERLLSAWSSDAIYEVGQPLLPVDPEIEEKARPQGIGRWGPNPKKIRRNQVVKPRIVEGDGNSKIAQPKFLSDQAKDESHGRDTSMKTLEDALKNAVVGGTTKTGNNGAPVIYGLFEIKYSKFGIQDFDFKFYNATSYSGLETHIANSYNNALLQLLRFTPLVRNFALHHVAADCRRDVCLLCELGFLFDTLEKAHGANCHATNFLRAFSRMDDARSKRVLDDLASNVPLSEMLQSSCSLILEHIIEEFKAIPGHDDALEETVILDVSTNQRCVRCHSKHDTVSKETHTALDYQIPNNNPRFRHQIPAFSQVLKNSIHQTNFLQSRGYCPTCKRYNSIVKQRTIRTLPDILVVNAAIPQSNHKLREAIQCWTKQGWLPDRIGVFLDHGRFTCFEGEDLRLHLQKGDHDLKIYDLVGVAADISSEESQSHLVSLINVSISQRDVTAENQWHLFNDFVIHKVSKEEALRFNHAWKVPSVMIFQATSSRHVIDDSWKSHLDTTLLYENVTSNPRYPDICDPLDPTTETPALGLKIAIDTEFVTLQRSEKYLDANGVEQTVRPAQEGLGRVSVVRGEGEKENLPFIDDYIRVPEHIIDYQTRFSGLEPGDLDPSTTPYILKPLKIVYKKIWLLSNLGCTFIGHGLSKDFRNINIHVPNEQVIDTAQLYRMEELKMFLALAYLAQEFLDERVQVNTHDSIEDARTALQLWHKYEELRQNGSFANKLTAAYSPSKLRAWKDKKIAREAEATGLDVASEHGEGRLTPDVMGRSGPGTPLKRPGIGVEYFESSLK